jgi:hypothetical protein
VPLDLGGDAASFSWLEALIQAGRMMDIQVIDDENDPFGLWIDLIDQIAQDFSAVKFGPPFPYPHAPEFRQWFHCHEKRTGAMPLILVIFPLGLPRLQMALFLPWLLSSSSSIRALAITRAELTPDFINCSSPARSSSFG